MNDSSDYASENAQLPDELPPVEAPTAGFLIQLFVIPAIIVAVVVVVYLSFGAIAKEEADPQQFRMALESSNPVRRWQAAHRLAQTLEANHAMAENQTLAADLVELLESQLDRGPAASEEERTFRAYLVTAVGRFHTSLGIPVLRRAMQPPHSVQIRARAVSALMDREDRGADLWSPELVADLIEVSQDEEPFLRKSSAFVMGSSGDPRFDARLEQMLFDGDVDVRYNAAVALARNGHASSVPVLVAMLDPENREGVRSELPQLHDRKASEILLNALAASEKLVESNHESDLSDLESPLVELREHPLRAVRIQTEGVLQALTARDSP